MFINKWYCPDYAWTESVIQLVIKSVVEASPPIHFATAFWHQVSWVTTITQSSLMSWFWNLSPSSFAHHKPWKSSIVGGWMCKASKRVVPKACCVFYRLNQFSPFERLKRANAGKLRSILISLVARIPSMKLLEFRLMFRLKFKFIRNAIGTRWKQFGVERKRRTSSVNRITWKLEPML